MSTEHILSLCVDVEIALVTALLLILGRQTFLLSVQYAQASGKSGAVMRQEPQRRPLLLWASAAHCELVSGEVQVLSG